MVGKDTGRSSTALAQEKGWEFLPEFTPLPDELVIEKCGHGAFHLTSLELGLQSLGVTHLVVMGVPTDVCVHTTLRQANDRGFECLLLSDCTGTTAQDTQLSALKQVGTFRKLGVPYFGVLIIRVLLFRVLY